MAGSDNRDHRDTGTEETREAVLADVRAHCKLLKDAGFDGDAYDIRVLVERLDAAWKRELESVTKRNGLGNAKKWRDALEWVKERIGGWWEYLEVEDEVEAALAAPPRNCDVGTAAEQNERYKRFCARHYQANNVDAQCQCCPCKEERWDCELEWAQMPYDAAQEGGQP